MSRFSARCFTFFFLLCFLSGRAVYTIIGLCRQPDGQRGQREAAGVTGFFILRSSFFAGRPGSVPFTRAPSGPACALSMSSIAVHAALTTPCSSSLEDHGHGAPDGHREEGLRPGQCRDVPLYRPADCLCAAACAWSLSVPGRLRVRRIVITALLLFYALLPDSGAGAQTGAGNVLNYGLCLFACTMVYLLRRRIREGAGAERPYWRCLALSSSRS